MNFTKKHGYKIVALLGMLSLAMVINSEILLREMGYTSIWGVSLDSITRESCLIALNCLGYYPLTLYASAGEPTREMVVKTIVSMIVNISIVLSLMAIIAYV